MSESVCDSVSLTDLCYPMWAQEGSAILVVSFQKSLFCICSVSVNQLDYFQELGELHYSNFSQQSSGIWISADNIKLIYACHSI